MPKLNVLMGGIPMAELHQAATGKLSLVYQERWRTADRAFPVSMSLPLTVADHHGRIVENFLWNLLPDNHDTLKSWGRELEVSHRSAFALLSKTGADCPGAIQLVSDQWMEENSTPGSGSIAWISEEEVAARLKKLEADRGWSGRRPGENGRFSLPGAQAKIALLEQDGRWGVPSGRIGTTHILKPPLPDFKGTVENEHACLLLARRLGLVAAETAVGHFGDRVAIVVKRYDRQRDGEGVVRRFHQEDLCQASGVHPDSKYQKDGGPSPQRIASILAQTTDPVDASERFMQALVFNFLAGGTDAHAKNYSLMHLTGRRTVMAPLYDIISYDPYATDEADLRNLKMAMKIGHYEFEKVMPRHWERLAPVFGLDPDKVVATVRSYAEMIPDEMSAVRSQCNETGLHHPVLDQMVDRLAARTDRIRRIYGTEAQAVSHLAM